MKAIFYTMTAAACVALAACHTHDHDHGDHDHAHSNHAHAGEAHGERFEWWGFTDAHEVFIDAAVPVPGADHTLFIHFTRLSDFEPESAMSARIEFKWSNGESAQVKGEVVQAGIWRVDWKAPTAGRVDLTLWWATASEQGQTDLGWIEFGPQGTTWEGWNQPDEAVGYTKEQAWSVPFATAEVRMDTVWSTRQVGGKWMPAPGEDRVVTAGASGTVRWSDGVAVAGASVHKGEVIARIEVADQADRGLAAEAAAAEAEWGAASAAVKRLEPLHAAGVVTAGEWQEAVARASVAEEAWERLQAVRAEQAWEVRSPVDGYVRAVRAASGEFVGPQSALCVLTTDREQWVELTFNPDWKEALRSARSLRVWTDAGWLPGHLASVANQIHQPSGLLSAYLVLDEVVPGAQPVAGRYVEVEAECGDGQPALVIPTAALLEQYGQYEVAVQVSGEQFEMRPVTIGERNARWTAVVSGLEAGERVATTGAYGVRMASLQGSTPAHGHTH